MTWKLLEDQEELYTLIQASINSQYPYYYKKEVVEWIKAQYSLERIKRNIEEQCCWGIYEGTSLIGTGSLQFDYLYQIFVHPNHQKQGYGTSILNFLEAKARKTGDLVTTDVPIPAIPFFEKRGYISIRHLKKQITPNNIFMYGLLEKELF